MNKIANFKTMPIITVSLVAVNCLVFFIFLFIGQVEDPVFMANHGAMFAPCVTDLHEYYRLITSMFLHFGFAHLFNNMIMLLALGGILEKVVGSIKFLMVYFASGVGGNILSLLWDIETNRFPVSAGASGAVFGLLGGLLYVALRNKGRVGNISINRLLLMIALTLYYGFSSGGVDNMAHIGGAVTGFLCTLLVYRNRQRKNRVFPAPGTDC